jgi:hypothetical protein
VQGPPCTCRQQATACLFHLCGFVLALICCSHMTALAQEYHTPQSQQVVEDGMGGAMMNVNVPMALKVRACLPVAPPNQRVACALPHTDLLAASQFIS